MEIGTQASVDFAAPAQGSIGKLCEESPVAIGKCRILQIVIKQNVSVGFSTIYFEQDLACQLTNALLSLLIGGDHRV